MAVVKKNVFLKGLSGKVGNMVFKQMPNGKTVVTTVPESNREHDTEARKATRSTFADAVRYGQAVLADEDAVAYYKKYGGKKCNTYNAAIRDYKRKPEILKVQCEKIESGLWLRIIVRDDTHVDKVWCEWGDEKMEATTDGLNTWEVVLPFSAEDAELIRVVGMDRPGNKGILEWKPKEVQQTAKSQG